uniref:C1q and TNF related 12 n=1 Tax=Saimiri boliviensis boliviensis TaxID=39432 RepID=A0A2K6SHU1_SAIBB
TATTSSLQGMPEAPKPSQASGPEFSDARRTWLNFVRRPLAGALRKRCRGRDTKPVRLAGVRSGPLGPPRTSRCAWAPELTLLAACALFPAEATEHRFSGPLDPVWPPGVGPRLLGEAFHCRLKGPRRVDKRMLVELDGFQAPATQGAFLRGSGLSLASGRFTAPASASSSSLPVYHSELQGKARLRVRGAVRVLVCIQSLCQRHMSLEVISGLGGNRAGVWLPAVVTSPYLSQAGQYAFVFADSGSGAVLTIQAGSSFSGLLLGT